MRKTDFNPTENLKELYAMLWGIPDEKFELECWRSVKGDPTLGMYIPDERLITDCGTAACAIGFATAYPPFVKQGLTISHKIEDSEPRFKHFKGWNAVTRFFGVNDIQANFLFLKSHYEVASEVPTKYNVMRRILSVLYDNGHIDIHRMLACKREVKNLELGVLPCP